MMKIIIAEGTNFVFLRFKTLSAFASRIRKSLERRECLCEMNGSFAEFQRFSENAPVPPEGFHQNYLNSFELLVKEID